MPPPIGKFDRRVVLEKPTEATDSFGGTPKGWTVVATVWARLVPEKGGESYTADQIVSSTPVVYEIRFRKDVGPKMRLLHRGKPYLIESVEEPDRNRLLRLTCVVFNAKSGRA